MNFKFGIIFALFCFSVLAMCGYNTKQKIDKGHYFVVANIYLCAMFVILATL